MLFTIGNGAARKSCRKVQATSMPTWARATVLVMWLHNTTIGLYTRAYILSLQFRIATLAFPRKNCGKYHYEESMERGAVGLRGISTEPTNWKEE